jgi:hypothetical protein
VSAIEVMPSEGFCFETENGFFGTDMTHDTLATSSTVLDLLKTAYRHSHLSMAFALLNDLDADSRSHPSVDTQTAACSRTHLACAAGVCASKPCTLTSAGDDSPSRYHNEEEKGWFESWGTSPYLEMPLTVPQMCRTHQKHRKTSSHT